MSSVPAEPIVIDASVIVDILAGTARSRAARTRIANAALHAPAHLDAEVLSALARLERTGVRTTVDVHNALGRLTALPVERYPITGLLAGAWTRRDNIRMADALYVELATQLELTLVTNDDRLVRACPIAESACEAERDRT
jgi:predicted nucleic acid-binding protein